jgi:hypothetical protein
MNMSVFVLSQVDIKITKLGCDALYFGKEVPLF